uniref:Transposase (Putative), gypsy type n=1 Tax=Tanacetum cinerariifolium TaxID=118510 RepID=A0A6L2L7U1_TANCI|nr:hypothetical protein [Tanacetum cinerariifolium]
MREEVLVHSGLSSMWFNKECDPVSRRIDNNVGSSEGAIISLPTPDEIATSLPDYRLVKKSKGPSQASRQSKRRNLQKRASKASFSALKVVSAPTLRLGKRLGAPPSIVVTSVSDPSHVGTSAPASTSGRSLSLKGVVVGGRVGNSGAQIGEILDDGFGTAACGEEIDLTIFPLAPGPYHMPYPYEGVSSPLYTREEWNGRHALESNIMCKDIFKDSDLSNRVNVLSTLLVSHGYELNSHYANLVSSKAHLQEKFDKKKRDVKWLRSERDATSEEVRKLQSQLTDAQTTFASLSEELTQTDDKLSDQALTSLVWKLLSSDEFHDALARVASLGINYGVERGLRIGHTDVEFEAAVQKVSNFRVGAKDDFDKALDNFPTTPFPFLSKIVATSEGGLPNVA